MVGTTDALKRLVFEINVLMDKRASHPDKERAIGYMDAMYDVLGVIKMLIENEKGKLNDGV